MSKQSLAAFWMLGAISAFSAMAVAGREVSVELDMFELMLYRSLIGLVLVLAIGAASGTLTQVSSARLDLHFIRNISHFTGQNLWFYALTVIPLAQVFALEFTSPLWVALLAPLVLGEPLTRRRILAVALGFFGVLIIARPGATQLGPGTLAAGSAAIGFALSALFTRRLTRTDSITSILFWLTLMQAILGLTCAGWDGDIALPGQASAPSVLVISIGGLLAHSCLTRALSLAPASVVIPIDFARLPVIAIVGALVYHEQLGPSLFLGAELIIGANLISFRSPVSQNAQETGRLEDREPR